MDGNTFYFQHDYHARKDPKCQALIGRFGVGAYGLYWSLVEIMHEQGGKIKKFPALYEGLSFELRIEKEELTKQIEAMLHDFELLVQDDSFIWSERVLKNIQYREAKKVLRSEAGKLGGIKSGISRAKRSKTKQCLKQNEANEPKERKGKEIKEKNIFILPSVEDIEIYCKERNNNIDPQYFYDYQTGRDWILKGGQKIKNWKSVIHTWEKNNFNNSPSNKKEAWEV